MIDTKREIERRLAALKGLGISGVNHAANMLTMQFGALREVTNFKGQLKFVGEWALHIQCNWRIERNDEIVATQDLLSGSDENAHRNANELNGFLVQQGPTTVENVTANNLGGVTIAFSRGLQLVLISDRVAGDEDWRFFEPTSDAKHFVIEGGKVDPWSLS